MPILEAKTDNWVDVQEMRRKHPKSFHSLSKTVIDKVVVDDYVKICNGFEQFWVKITLRHDDTFIGVVDTDLIDASKYDRGNEVCFGWNHIYDVHHIEPEEGLTQEEYAVTVYNTVIEDVD